MTIANEAIFGPFFRFFRNVKCFAQQVGRYHGLYVRAIDPPDTQASPPMQVCLCSAQERDPEHPHKEPFGRGQILQFLEEEIVFL